MRIYLFMGRDNTQPPAIPSAWQADVMREDWDSLEAAFVSGDGIQCSD